MGHDNFYEFLLDLALILLCTKIFGIFSKRVRMPQVVGALVAGVIMGPAVLGIVSESELIKKLAELGVIVLMFSAGMEMDLKELKRSGKSGILVASLGVIIPLAGGFALAALFNGGFSNMDQKAFLQNVFMGTVLTATSVSITVETLKELGHLNSKSGTIIVSAALIDDVLGIILLTIVSGTADTSVNVWVILGKIVAFFVLAVAVGFVFYVIFERLTGGQKERRRYVLITFSFCLILAYVAEHYFGVADITGAFIAGVVLSNTRQVHFINRRFDILSYMLLAPVFFASVGISISKVNLNGTMLLMTLLLIVVAVISKIVGCGVGARLSGCDGRDSLRVGIGMVSRGEVALIVANKGLALGLMPEVFVAPLVVTVVVTTIITPILLKIVYQNKHSIA
ncbi:MAG TPA: cation:proton antiporter [Thermoclostridium caenicola]|uniref:cation:proton antiporter n=1 Tax=Thermoclostridium caenicola TaxID=659425 RepID=UPI002BE43EC2|nr:cation:proton antiporter [Thermoclostridium caenicola]HOL85589.1 cation:proton antiporter [Thermoclostridium caenicola]HOP71898.1 cation:proton antiporter [Thermoclostridium caenicola]HPO77779.1 cation:proton antiporter [Thermoclostridium caenicola]HPU22278.1 cation:proton antiporter [Thermoclostridium caenicola]